MKKLGLLLGMAAVLFLACNVNWGDLTMPEQVKVEATPGLYLPLTGNLFSGEFEAYSPEKLVNDTLSPSKVKEMIGGSMPGITVATYDDPDHLGTLTYLLRYPIAEMPLELSSYMQALDFELPEISQNVGGVKERMAEIQDYVERANSQANHTNGTLISTNQEIHIQNLTGTSNVDIISGMSAKFDAIERAIEDITPVLGKDPEADATVASTIRDKNTIILEKNSEVADGTGGVNDRIMAQNATIAAQNANLANFPPSLSSVINEANAAIATANQSTGNFQKAITEINAAKAKWESAATTTVEKNNAIVAMNTAIAKLNVEIGTLQTKLIPANLAIKNAPSMGLQQYLAPYLLSCIYGLPITIDDLFQEYRNSSAYQPIPDGSVPIRDMANLVESVTYTQFGIKIEGNFADVLKIGISDGNHASDGLTINLGSGTYNDGYTHFVALEPSGKTWKPSKNHGALTIQVELLKFPPLSSLDDEGNITVKPEFVLEWTEVKVNPGENGEFADALPLDLSSLGETLNNIEFESESVKAYLYTSGLPESNATVSLISSPATAGGENVLLSDTPLKKANAPQLPADGGDYTGPLTPSSLDDGAIDLTNTLNASLSGEVTLNYKVKIGTTTLTQSDIKDDTIISAVLLIKLPLALRYSGAITPIEGSDYVKFEMEEFDLSSMFDDDEDLLEPIKGEFNSGGVSGQLDLTTMSLILADCDVTLLQGVCIAIKQNKDAATSTLIDFSSKDAGDDIRIELVMDMDEPFAPSIDILLKKDPFGNFATLSLKKNGRFRFGLIAEIESALDATVTL